MTENQNKVSQAKYALAAFLSVTIFVIIYKYNFNSLIGDGLMDIKDHLAHAESIYWNTFWDRWLQRPYPLWHLSVKVAITYLGMPSAEAASFVCGLYAMICYYVTFVIIDRLVTKSTGVDGGVPAACAAACLSLVQPLYMWWFNQYQYEGQFSINPIFNPTHMTVKPFGLLTFLFAIDLIRRYQGEETVFCTSKKMEKLLFPLFSAALFFSALAKPTFMYMLLPAGMVYLLINLVRDLIRKDGSWKKTWNFMWKIACASIPALVYLVFQYAAFYFWGGTNEDAKVTIYPFLTAWHIYSPNVFVSIILSMLFPLWMVGTNLKYFCKSVEGRLSLIGYVVGTLEFSFFVETGDKLGHLNFSWPMMSGMLLLWVISAMKLVKLTTEAKPGAWSAVKVSVGWIFLAVHLFSGLYYINPFQYII